MNVPFRPILSALLRNRAGAMLVALQVAITLAVLVNAVYIVKQRVELIDRPTGIDVDNIFVVGVTGFTKQFNYNAMLDEDIQWLSSVPGVIAVTAANSVPLSGGGSSDIIKLTPGAKGGHENLVNYFYLNEQGAEALGVKIVGGRWFKREEVQAPLPTLYSPYTGPVVVTRQYADRIYPKGDALGKVVYGSSNQPMPIVGIVEHMLGSPLTGVDHPTDIMYMPLQPSGPSARYIVRAKPGMRDPLMRKVEAELGPRNDMRAIGYVRTLSLYKARSYLTDRNMAIYLVVVTALLLAITSLGIFALATFNVSTRTKQVGTRRAVTTTR